MGSRKSRKSNNSPRPDLDEGLRKSTKSTPLYKGGLWTSPQVDPAVSRRGFWFSFPSLVAALPSESLIALQDEIAAELAYRSDVGRWRPPPRPAEEVAR